MRRRIITALVTGTATVLLAGCGPLAGGAGGDTPTAVTTTALASPREKLAAAVPDGSAGRYAFSFKDAQSTTKGVVEPKAKRVSMTTSYKEPELGFTLTMSYLVVEADQWVKISFDKKIAGLPQLPKKWLRVDPAKIEDNPFDGAEDPDPIAAGMLFDAIVDVKESEPGTYAGTLDLTKAPEAQIVDEDGLKALGAKAKGVAFTATLDDAGRLSVLDIKVPAYAQVKAFTHHATYGDYGSAAQVEAPAASASQDAPDEAYELLNS